MKIRTTTNPSEIKFDGETAVILADDKDWLLELAQNIKNCADRQIIREAEHDFLEEMTNRYGGKLAGGLLGELWRITK